MLPASSVHPLNECDLHRRSTRCFNSFRPLDLCSVKHQSMHTSYHKEHKVGVLADLYTVFRVDGWAT